MRFAVESWSPEFGAPVEAFDDDSTGQAGSVDTTVELLEDEWRPLTASIDAAPTVLFVDGVQQIDARVWTSEDGISRMGMCVSLAAGAVRCNGTATVENVRVRRAVFGPAGLGDIDCGPGLLYHGVATSSGLPADLDNEISHQREDLEIGVALSLKGADLVVVDGRVHQRESIPGVVGYLKSHQTQYLKPELAKIVGQLGAGQRTPVFLLTTSWTRYTWYLRLPGGIGHAWAGIVRCEASPTLRLSEVVELADRTAATLPRFASQSYKDPRAPQNLSPVAGLERDMRRRLGDRTLLLRALQRTSATAV